ncbi:hypothetical protein BGX34_009914 [Mortierella sp. NVP85]|nr:hypothetical protein BGX34_009914 [Mortierella sp. NVP85]
MPNPTLLPEILILVGRFLCHDDIAACVLVSRAWQSAMQPLLWTRVPLVDEQTFTEDPILFPHPDAVLLNIYRVLSLDLSRVADPARLQALTPLLQNQLSELSVAHYSTDVDQILAQNRATLRSFTCSSSRLSHQMQQMAGFQSFLPRHEATAFWTRMTSLERLDSLDLTATTVYDEHLEIFFTICGRLRSLSLKRGSIVSMHPPTKEPFHKMRRLELSGIANAVHSQLQFITQCPNLEHLAWTSTQATPLIALLVHITTQPELELRQITSIDFTDSLMSDKDLATILSCLPNLRRLIVPWSLFGELCFEAISGKHVFAIRHGATPKRDTIPISVEAFSYRLSKVHVTWWISRAPWDIQERKIDFTLGTNTLTKTATFSPTASTASHGRAFQIESSLWIPLVTTVTAKWCSRRL